MDQSLNWFQDCAKLGCIDFTSSSNKRSLIPCQHACRHFLLKEVKTLPPSLPTYLPCFQGRCNRKQRPILLGLTACLRRSCSTLISVIIGWFLHRFWAELSQTTWLYSQLKCRGMRGRGWRMKTWRLCSWLNDIDLNAGSLHRRNVFWREGCLCACWMDARELVHFPPRRPTINVIDLKF